MSDESANGTADNGEMHFEDLEPVEVPFTVGRRRFLLREADTSVYTKYRDGMQREITVDAKTKKVSAGASTKAQIQVISMSLTELVVAGDARTMRRKVAIDTVMAFKPAVTRWIFDKLCEISPGLAVGDEVSKKHREDELKNLPPAGTDSSDTAETTEFISTS